MTKDYPIQFLIVFLITATADVCWTRYIQSVEKMLAVQSGAWSALVILLGATVTIGYVQQPSLIVAAVLGAFVGTFVTVAYGAKKT